MKSILINDNLYVEVVKYFLVLVGMWNHENVRQGWLRRVYRLYSRLPIAILAVYLLLMILIIPILVRKHKGHEVGNVIGYVVSYVVEVLKVYMFASSTVAAVYGQVSASCRFFVACPDRMVRSIFMASAGRAILINKFCCYGVAFGVVVLNAGAWYQYNVIYPRDLWNATDKPMPLMCWLPFDPEVYYGWAIIAQNFGVLWGGSFYAALQCMLVGLIVYVSGQLLVLQHCFRHFQKYSEDYSERYGVSRDVAVRYVMKCLINWHQEIVRFNVDLNKGLTYIMLTELMLNSILIASLLFQMANLVVDFTTPFNMTYTVLMLSHVFILYWHANEVIMNSMGIADALLESNWNDEDIWVQKCVAMVVIRAQRPLTITCGPFTAASTASIVSVLKAAYSYAMLFMR